MKQYFVSRIELMNPEGVLFASVYKNVETNVWKWREMVPHIFCARLYRQRTECLHYSFGLSEIGRVDGFAEIKK